MTMKLGLIALAAVAALMFLFRPKRVARRPAARTPPTQPVALEACPRCGVYRAAGSPCDCDRGRSAEA